jgi:hypothetical protein
MVQWPWQSDRFQCKHLIKYSGQSIELPALSFQGFELGKLAIKPELM